ncbi:hypothetical protein AMR47_13320 [Leptospira interrogans]|nr:hypothetical protein AMR47_13320 [Leptospira interrogans]
MYIELVLKTFPKTPKCGNYHENLTTLLLLRSSQIARCSLNCRNYCISLEISKKLSCKIF